MSTLLRRVGLLGCWLLCQVGASAAEQLPVVGSSSIVADWLQQIGGERLQVSALIGPGQDPHSFRPAPKTAASLEQARLIVLIGGGLEAGITQMTRRYQERCLPLAELLFGDGTDAAAATEQHAHHHHHGEHCTGHHGVDGLDPHFWHDPLQVVRAVEAIRDRLIAIDPAGAEVYRRGAQDYQQALQEVDAWAHEQIATIPAERRTLISTHQAFGHFIAAYGFRDLGSLLDSHSTVAANPSPKRLAELVASVKEHGVVALFPERDHQTELLQVLARESNLPLAEPLGTGSLGRPGADDDSYLGFFRRNVTIIVEALRP